MKKKIKIDFVDFWPDFHKKDNYFYHLLSQNYDVLIDSLDPDIVIGSFGFSKNRDIKRYENHRCLKVYYSGENDGPRSEYDINITQWREIDSKTHMRMPLWAFFISWFDEIPLVHSRDPSFLVPWSSLNKSLVDIEAIVDSKKKFCSFIYADLTSERKKWFDVISQLQRVDSAGQCLNNLGHRIPGRGDQAHKIIFLSEYFFSLAIENSCVNGYATEKLLHPMSSLTIPLYWGDPKIDEDINVDAIVDLRKSPNDVIDEMKFLISDKRNFINKLSKPWFNKDFKSRYKTEILEFIESAARIKGVI